MTSKRLTAVLSIAAWTVAVLLGLFLPGLFWDGGMVEMETTTYLQQYLDGRPLAQKIFNPLLNDDGYYQGRELSYLFDCFDAHAFRWLIGRGVVLYLPLSGFVATLLMAGVWWWGTRRVFGRLERLDAALLLLVLFSSFVFVSTMGMLYRSAKPLMAPLLLALMFVLAETLRAAPREASRFGSWRRAVVTFVLASGIGLLDRQGFFYVVVAALILLGGSLYSRRALGTLGAALGAAAVTHGYNTIVGPRLIHWANGYWPDFSFQDVAYANLWRTPHVWVEAAHLLVLNLRAVAGSFHPLVYLVVAIALGYWVWRSRRAMAPASTELPLWSVVATILGAHLLMFSIMIIRHPWVYESVDHRFWYYPLPFLMTVLFALGLALAKLGPWLHGGGRWVLSGALVLIAAANLFALSGYRAQMLTGEWWFPNVHEQSARLREAVRQGEADLSGLNGARYDDYRGLCLLIRRHLPANSTEQR